VLRLLTLGQYLIESRRSLGPAAHQSRPLALLAVIAAAGSRGVSREQLLVYFWPESTSKSARNTLNQTLFALRRDLGTPDLFLPGRVLRLNQKVITADQWDFEAALGRRELTDAVALYRGKFLQNFDLPGAPEFERWLEQERDRLAQRFFQGLSTLATRASDKGDNRQSAEWWRELTTHDPLSSFAAAGYITALSAAGDRPAAIAFLRQYETRLKEDLGVPVDAAIEKLKAHLAAEGGHDSPIVTAPQVSRALEDLSGFDRFTKRLVEIAAEGDGKHTSLSRKIETPDLAGMAEELYKTIVENSVDVIYCADANGAFTYVNTAGEKLLGMPRTTIVGRLFIDFVREDYRHPMVELYMRQMHDHVPVTYYEFPAVPPSGRAVWLGQHVQLVEHNGKPVGILAIARDITLRKRLERSQGYLAVRDRSTKLLNAGAFRALVEHRMALARRNGEGFHVLFLRVENMNDTSVVKGPAEAEEMAQHLADALRATFRTSDILARLQPDEFAVVAIEAGPDAARLITDRLQANLDAITRSPAPRVGVSHAYYDPKFPASVEALFSTHSAVPA
jgi:PAS domain S-box-containing protein/diguanylate cyclase (GGDEF)-like protein